jgi:nucleolar protein 14
MPKRKTRSKRSLTKLPKGLPIRKGGEQGKTNPFEFSHRQPKKQKFDLGNRANTTQPSKPSALAVALENRQLAIKQAFLSSKKANVFSDKRIGEYDNTMSIAEQNLVRLVKERSRVSKRSKKYALNDDANDAVLTHRGKAVDQLTAADHAALLSDDDDEDNEGGQLDAADTALHFGGLSSNKEDAVYGSSSAAPERMSQLYAARKTDLDDLILRRKILKAERLQSKEKQEEVFEKMDESFDALRDQLTFRDKEADIRHHLKSKREGTLSPEDQEMADWDKEMKQYLHVDRKVAATDRTKTPEEIAKEDADRLHELETRRLARMSGDFENDNFSDVDEGETKYGRRGKRKTIGGPLNDNPEALSDSEEEDEDKLTTCFTADGLVTVNKKGEVVGKVGEAEAKDSEGEQQNRLASELSQPVAVGTEVYASYRATEQYDGNESWFTGTVKSVQQDGDGYKYDIEYTDGDFEEAVQPCHIKVIKKSEEELDREEGKRREALELKRLRLKAKEKARYVYSQNVLRIFTTWSKLETALACRLYLLGFRIGVLLIRYSRLERAPRTKSRPQ